MTTASPLGPVQPTGAAVAGPVAPRKASVPASEPFQAALAGVSIRGGTVTETPAAAALSAPPVSIVSRGSRSGELSPEQQFESFVLRSFVESMLPAENTSFFGTGTAGKIWKSMLAERIGDEMAAAGGIGVAKLVTKQAPPASLAAAGAGLAEAAVAATVATVTSTGRN